MKLTAQEFVQKTYPHAWEDSLHTIWESEELGQKYQLAAQFMASDTWCEHILGWTWEDAAQNLRDLQAMKVAAARRASHPKITRTLRWIRKTYRFWRLIAVLSHPFQRERVPLATAWSVSKLIWNTRREVKRG